MQMEEREEFSQRLKHNSIISGLLAFASQTTVTNTTQHYQHLKMFPPPSSATWLLLLLAMLTTSTTNVRADTTATESLELSRDGFTSGTNTTTDTAYHIAVIPKSLDNPFFDIARDGCMDAAAALSRSGIEVVCDYTGPPGDADDNDGQIQAAIMHALITGKGTNYTRPHGIAVAVRAVETLQPMIDLATREGIPVVTFDSDAPDSTRLQYIGTDNYFFGTQIAKLLKQLKPNGGTFGVVASLESLNLQERAAGFVDELLHDEGLWTPVSLVEENPYYVMDVQSNITLAMEHMYALAALDPPPTAIAPVMGMPMRSCCWKEFVDDMAKELNITLVSGDAMPNQIEFLERGYVHGLVGQLPYDFGAISVQTLVQHVMHMEAQGITDPKALHIENDVIGTNVLTLVQVPLVLPHLTVNHNLLHTLRAVGFTLCGIVFVMAIGFAIWVFVKRNLYVVKVAQPGFLIMVAAGTLVMASALIPLSFDDNYNDTLLEEQQQSTGEAVTMCMSIPWLASTGFTIMFSALFAKLYRVNTIFHSMMTKHQNANAGSLSTTDNANNTPRRITVTAQDVLIPFVVLLSLNTIILTLWTVLDPLTYVRHDLPGMDGWNRVIATYGSCQSNHVEYYLIPLACINLSVLLMANYQAYQARQQNIQSEFAEAKYIGIAMASLLQAMLSGIPILFVVRQSPQAYYLVLCFMIFIISAVVLIVIFVPKIVLVDQTKGETQQEQKQRLTRSIMRHSTALGTGRNSAVSFADSKSNQDDTKHKRGHDNHDDDENEDHTSRADNSNKIKTKPTDQFDDSSSDNEEEEEDECPEMALPAAGSDKKKKEDLFVSPLSIMDDGWKTVVVHPDQDNDHSDNGEAATTSEQDAATAANTAANTSSSSSSPITDKKKSKKGKKEKNKKKDSKDTKVGFSDEKPLSLFENTGWNTVVERD